MWRVNFSRSTRPYVARLFLGGRRILGFSLVAAGAFACAVPPPSGTALPTTSHPSTSQPPQTVITPEGKTAVLHPSGAWQYAYNKPTTATEVVRGARVSYEVWLDKSKWTTRDGRTNKDSDHEFYHVKGDAFALVMATRWSIPFSSLKTYVLENAKSGGTRDAKIILEEKRSVNGVEVLCLQWEGTLHGMPITFYGYHYSGRQGAIHLVTGTGPNLFDEYRADFTDFLNGLIVK